MLQKFNTFSGEAEVAGQTRTVSWDGDMFCVHGITSFVEAAEIISFLATGKLTGWTGDALKQMGSGSAPPKVVTPSTTVTAGPVVAMKPAPKLSKGGEESVLPPAAQEAKPTPAPAQAATEAPAAPAADPVADDKDLTIFTRLTNLREIVEECVRRGKGKSFEELKAYVLHLKDSLACPALERIERAEGGPDGLVDRLQTMAFNKNVPGS